MINFCFITNFPLSISQWSMVFRANKNLLKDNGIDYHEAHINPSAYRAYKSNEHNLKELTEADIVYLYVGTCNCGNWMDWEAPYYIRNLMKKGSKLAVWFDNEMTQPRHFYPKYPDVKIDHIIGLLPNLYPFTEPVSQCNMPQLARPEYSCWLNKPAKDKRNGKVAIMVHSTKDANSNVTKQFPNLSFRVFESRGMGRMDKATYLTKLSECAIGLDFDITYYGWSRFAFECALTSVPCIGMTEGVKQLYPSLYTTDISQVNQLLKRLSNPAFYNSMIQEGKSNLYKLTPDYCIKHMIHILRSIK